MRETEQTKQADEAAVKVVLPPEAAGKNLLDAIHEAGIPLDSPCDGHGKCGKCKVTAETPEGWKELLSCRSICPEGGITLRIPRERILGEKTETSLNFAEKKKIFSEPGEAFCAVDIGTTTVEAALAVRDKEKKTYEVADTFSCLNPQKARGADVISRIVSAEKEGTEPLRQDVLRAINGALAYFRKSHPELIFENIYVAGNTTMQHLLLGVSPAGIGKYPFRPAFTEMKELTGEETGIDAARVTVLPSADAYIGADVVCGVLAENMENLPGTLLLLDLGTNGEMVLKTGEKLLATSSAAGPCLEGANISSGTGGVPGAISSVWEEEGEIRTETVGNRKPIGLCGAGLVDLAALLLDREIVDETGYMEDDFVIPGTEVGITPRDIRELQLAKAAISAGVETLLEKAGEDPKNVEKVFLAGGLGKHVHVENAARVGILHPALAERTVACGNSALEGALLAGADPENLEKLKRIAREMQTFSLNESSSFNDRFVENMTFERSEE